MRTFPHSTINILAKLLSNIFILEMDGWYLSSSLMKYHNHLSLHLIPAHIGRVSPHCQILFSDWSIPRHTSFLSSHWLLGCALSPAETSGGTRWVPQSDSQVLPGRLLSEAAQWLSGSVAHNEEMMRSCNCSKLPQSRPGPYFLPTQRQFQFTAMFGVNYNVSELWAHFTAITVNLRLAVMKWFSIIQ